MHFCNEDLTKKSIGYNPSRKKDDLNTISISVGIEKYEFPRVEIENGEIIVKLGVLRMDRRDK